VRSHPLWAIGTPLLAIIITAVIAIGVGMTLLTIFHSMPHSTAKIVNAILALSLAVVVGGVLAIWAARTK
jgi:uncharacterized membrane protein